MKPLRSRFYWRLRRVWHSPAFHTQDGRQSILGDIFGDPLSYYRDDRSFGRGRLAAARDAFRYSRRMSRGQGSELCRGLWWRFLWLLQFRCNGDRGGWRTELCDWLECRARAAEHREDGPC